MDPSPAVEAQITAKVRMLERFFDRTIGCDVVIEAPPHHSRKGHPFNVRLDIAVPGGPPVVVSHPHHDRADHDDAYVAIRDAFNAAKRQLQDRARKQRGEVKLHPGGELDRGRIWHLVASGRYGFILALDGAEIYFHENALVGVEYDSLEVGTEVVYTAHDDALDTASVASVDDVTGPRASTVKLASSRAVI